MLRIRDHGRLLWAAAIGLSFFVGLAMGNGYETTNAVRSSVLAERAACSLRLERALERQRNTLKFQ